MKKGVKIALISTAFVAALTTGIILWKRKKKTVVKAVTDGKGNTVQLNEIQSAILTEATKWVGVREIVENKGFENKEFQNKITANAGWVKNEAYCAAFVKMVLVEVSSGNAKKFFKQNASKGSLLTWQNLSKKNEYTEVIKVPEAGCLVCYNGHTEICKSTDGKVNTVISANSPFTAQDGGGQGVVERTRPAGAPIQGDKGKVEPFLGYIRIKKLS